MICHTMSAQVAAIEKVIEAVKSGELSQHAIKQSFDRVTRLKGLFLSIPSDKPNGTFERASMNSRHSKLAAEIYAKSATVVRSSPGSLPISNTTGSNIVFLSPGKVPLPSGAVDSGEEKTREPYISADFISQLHAYDSSIVDKKYYDGESISSEILLLAEKASTVILCTRNGSLSPYQRRLGLDLGRRLGDKLIVVATCDPYDFLSDEAEVKNYITIYEPTVPAFRAAVDIMFGKLVAQGSLPVQQPRQSFHIQPFDKVHDTAAILDLWAKALPHWKLEEEILAPYLIVPNAKHFVVLFERRLLAFCLSYITDGFAQIAVLAVESTHRNLGIGTALVSHARKTWESSEDFRSFSIGSFGPRFWPAVPLSFPSAISFFQHRGFHLDPSPPSRDLFADIRTYKTPDRVEGDIMKHKLSFAPWSKDTYEECMAAQQRAFKGSGWVSAYKRLADGGQHHEAMVAFDRDGKQVGWAIMCSPSGLVAGDFAFSTILGKEEGVDGKKVGVIACVGVDYTARGKGIGLALVSRAVEDMKRRGMEGVLVDWVLIRGFYEKLGFKPACEYQSMEW